MKKLTILISVFILNSAFCIFHSYAASYTWTGTTSTAWGINTNWSPSGIPGAGDNVTIVSATNAPLYDGVAGVTNLTMTSGTLDLNGYTLSMTGTGAFNGGTITNGKINSSGGTTTFAGTTFNCKVRTVSANFYLNGSVFNDSTYIEKTGSSNNTSIGGNKYNAWTEIVCNGTGAIYMSYGSPYNPDTANADIKFTKKSGATFHAFRSGTGHLFNGKVIVECTTTASGIMYLGELSTVTFNDDIEFNNPIGADIRIAYDTGANHTLASGKKINIGGAGFSGGALRFNYFTQIGSTKQELTLTGTAYLHLINSVFNAPVKFKAGNLQLNGAWFKDSVTVEQTAGSASSSGANVFDGPTTITNSGTGYMRMAATYPDTFNNSLKLINKGSSYISLPHNLNGSYFNGDVTIKQTGSGQAIYLGLQAGANGPTLASGYKLLVDTFNTGTLFLYGFKQLGTTEQNITLTGTAYMYINTAVFNATSYFEAPNIYLSGSKFNKKSTFKKTGGANNASAGGNVFNDTLVLLQNSSAGYFMMCNTARDTCNGDIHTKNSGSNYLYLNYNQPCVYNGNIYISGSVGNTYFGANTGTGTLASGKTIIEDTDGFTGGNLYLRNFTKNGTTAINLDLGSAGIIFSTGSTLNGTVTVTAAAIYLSGTTFNNNVDFLQNGSVNVSGTGGNTFNGTFKVRATGTGQFLMNSSTTLSDIFNGDAEFINECAGTGGSNGHMFPAYRGPNMQFNGSKTIFTNISSVDRGIYISQYGTCTFNSNIEINNTSTGNGVIDFGSNSASITLASGKTISVGGLGFSKGALYIRGFYQIGNTSQSITTTGSSSVWFRKPSLQSTNRSTFDGTVTINSPRIYLNGAIFKDDASFTATGAYTIANDGDNEYQQDFTFNNTGSGNKTFANVTRDVYKGNATFTSSSGTFYIAHTGENTFSGNLIVSGSPDFYFANGGGKVVMDGTGVHTIKRINGGTTRTFTVDKPGNYTTTFKNIYSTNDLTGRMW